MTRVDALLLELQSRHRNDDPAFLAAIRPIVEQLWAELRQQEE